MVANGKFEVGSGALPVPGASEILTGVAGAAEKW